MDSLRYLKYRLRHSLPRGNARKLFVTVFLVLAIPVGVLVLQQVQRYRTGAVLEQMTLYFEPAQQDLPPDSNFKLMADAKTNQVGFVRLEFTFDTSKVSLASEVNITSRLATVVQKTTMAQANSTGNVVVVAALQPSDRENPLTGIVELLNFNVHAVSAQPDVATTLAVNNAGIQLVDMQSQIIPFTSQQASLILNKTAAATSTPIATSTNAPTGTPVPLPTETLSVQITDAGFIASNVTVTAGTTVTWTNNGSTPHTVTSDTGVWDSGTIQPGQTYSRTFNTAGTFAYHCMFHPTMIGTITVTGSTTPTVTLTPTPLPTNTNTPTPTRTPTPMPTSTNVPTATSTAVPTATTTPKTGDINGDGLVNSTDIGIIVTAYGTQPPSDARADVNKDGRVNIVDIGIIIDNYGL